MEYTNNPQLAGWLTDSGFSDLAAYESFTIDDAQFEREGAILGRNRVAPGTLSDRTAFRCLTIAVTQSANPINTTQPPVADHLAQFNQLLTATKALHDKQDSVHELQADGYAKLSASLSANLNANAESYASGLASLGKSIESQFEAQIADIHNHLDANDTNLVVVENKLLERLAAQSEEVIANLNMASESISDKLIDNSSKSVRSLSAQLTASHDAMIEQITESADLTSKAISASASSSVAVGESIKQSSSNLLKQSSDIGTSIIKRVEVTERYLAEFAAASQRQLQSIAGTLIEQSATQSQRQIQNQSNQSHLNRMFKYVFILLGMLIFLGIIGVVEGYSQQAPPPARVSTSAPTYANNDRVPLRVNSDGALVTTNGGTATTVTISGTVVTSWLTASPNVTVSNGSGASAVNIQDGGNSITVDGTVSLASGTTVISTFNTPNIAVNLTQVAGATVVTDAGTSTAAIRVAVATNDPCGSGSYYTHSFVVISTATSSTLVTNSNGSLRPYICAVNVGPLGTATNVAIVYGTGTVCATSIDGAFGGTSAANGWNVAANGGIAYGNGTGTLSYADAVGENICIIISAGNQINGSITYVLAP